MASNNPRVHETWIDTAKGLGIIAVVAGHANCPGAAYLYWFHMPLFFALSGYLFKPQTTAPALRKWAWARTKKLLIPYVSFLILITLTRYAYAPPHGLHAISRDLYRVVEGKYVAGYDPVWFITCLYATQILFALIVWKFRDMRKCLLVVGAAYVLAHVESYYAHSHSVFVPLDLDVALLALSYYAFGYYARSILSTNDRRIMLPAVVLSAVFLIGGLTGVFSYGLDMKYIRYYHIALDLLVPISMLTAVCALSHLAASNRLGKGLAVLGIASLPIMYLHSPLNIYLRGFHNYMWAMYTVIGIVIPFAVCRFVFQRFDWTRALFLGAFRKP